MLKIRLQRVGRRNNPAFRVVVTESTRGPKSGDNVELLGTYSPHTDGATLNTERIKHWIDNGAQVSDTVHNILINEKVIDGKKKNALPKKSPIKKETEASAEETSSEATPEGEQDSAPVESEAKAEAPAEETPVEGGTPEAPEEAEKKKEEVKSA